MPINLRSGATPLTTDDLINAAIQAKADLDAAVGNLKTAQAAWDTARIALHDDLAANGPALHVDGSTTPPTYTIYTAVDPDGFSATPIRSAA